MIGSVRVQIASRAVLLAGLALWMSIAVLNNLTDPATNMLHLETMLSMQLLIEDPAFGNGLEWRALPGLSPRMTLLAVMMCQTLVAGALWFGVALFARDLLSGQPTEKARSVATLALTTFLGLWLFFLCGGLWFGYWMKQGAIQGVHLTLVIIAISSLTYINTRVQQPDMRA